MIEYKDSFYIKGNNKAVWVYIDKIKTSDEEISETLKLIADERGLSHQEVYVLRQIIERVKFGEVTA